MGPTDCQGMMHSMLAMYSNPSVRAMVDCTPALCPVVPMKYLHPRQRRRGSTLYLDDAPGSRFATPRSTGADTFTLAIARGCIKVAVLRTGAIGHRAHQQRCGFGLNGLGPCSGLEHHKRKLATLGQLSAALRLSEGSASPAD
jgi:hypothetical protein